MRSLLIVLTVAVGLGASPARSQAADIHIAQAAPPPLPLPPPSPPPPEPQKPAPPQPLERPPTPPAEGDMPTARTLFVREVRVAGSTVFSRKELAPLTAPYTNQRVSLADLERLRQALTHHYVQHGYITSGAVIPDQTMIEGVLTIQIVEGRVSRVEIDGLRWFRASTIRRRLAPAMEPPLHAPTLQTRLQLLQTDPRIEQVRARLERGPTPGESILHVQVIEAARFKAWGEVNNFQSPLVGAEQGFLTVTDRNPLGLGDTLSLRYGRSLGAHPILDLRYAVPVTAEGTTPSIGYRRFEFAVIEEPFEDLDITNEAEIIGVSVRHPVFRTPSQEFAVGLTAEHLRNTSLIGGAPFEVVPGAKDGVFRISALRFSQEWSHRDGAQALHALSRLSLGIDVLGATTTSGPDQADSRFFSWLGSMHWLRHVQPWRMQILTRGTLQLASDHLFPLEQIPVGGRYSVRGYREFSLLRDNAFLASLEARIPVLRSDSGADLLYAVPFVDLGHAWQTTVSTPEPMTLASLGIGALWTIRQGSRFELYWGQRLRSITTPDGNLQDLGLHFQLVMEVF